MVLKIRLWVLSNIKRSVLVVSHISEPYSIMGRQRAEYSLWEVIGWRQPKREPTTLRAKKALRPAEQRAEVRSEVVRWTLRRTPRWWYSSTS